MKSLLALLVLCGHLHAQPMRQNGASPATIILDITGQTINPGALIVSGTGTIQGSNFSVGGSTFACAGGSCSTAGVKDGSAASAGFVGELMSNSLGVAQIPSASASYVAIATVTLTAGDWYIWAVGAVDAGATTACTQIIFAISANNTATDSGPHSYNTYGPASTVIVANGSLQTAVVGRRVSISTTTPYYLLGRLLYTVLGGATFNTASTIYAMRIR